MISQAKELTDEKSYSNVSYKNSFAEQLSFLDDGTVDIVVAGQAAHWFNYDKLFPELARILRKNGTLAFWGYCDHVWVDYHGATAKLHEYAYSANKDKLGSYWTEPGRSIVEGLLRDIKPPKTLFMDITREEYVPGTNGPCSGTGQLFLSRDLTLAEAQEFIRTWSAYHGWQEAHPTLKKRSEGGEGDVVDRLFDEIKNIENWTEDETVLRTEWGSGLILARNIGIK